MGRGQRGMSRDDTVESTFGGDDDAPISEQASLLSASPSNPTGFQYASPLQHKELDKDLSFSSETNDERIFERNWWPCRRVCGNAFGRTEKGGAVYDDKVGELEKHLSLLLESVASSAMFRRTSSTDEEDVTRTAAELLMPGHHRRT